LFLVLLLPPLLVAVALVELPVLTPVQTVWLLFLEAFPHQVVAVALDTMFFPALLRMGLVAALVAVAEIITKPETVLAVKAPAVKAIEVVMVHRPMAARAAAAALVLLA
jgi:hypothetical protein